MPRCQTYSKIFFFELSSFSEIQASGRVNIIWQAVHGDKPRFTISIPHDLALADLASWSVHDGVFTISSTSSQPIDAKLVGHFIKSIHASNTASICASGIDNDLIVATSQKSFLNFCLEPALAPTTLKSSDSIIGAFCFYSECIEARATGKSVIKAFANTPRLAISTGHPNIFPWQSCKPYHNSALQFWRGLCFLVALVMICVMTLNLRIPRNLDKMPIPKS